MWVNWWFDFFFIPMSLQIFSTHDIHRALFHMTLKCLGVFVLTKENCPCAMFGVRVGETIHPKRPPLLTWSFGCKNNNATPPKRSNHQRQHQNIKTQITNNEEKREKRKGRTSVQVRPRVSIIIQMLSHPLAKIMRLFSVNIVKIHKTLNINIKHEPFPAL